MFQFKCMILSTLLSFGAFAKESKLLDIYKDSDLRGALGIDIDRVGNINFVYSIDNGERLNHKLSDLKTGLPVVQKFKFHIVSIISNDFNRETGGTLTVRYVTHKTGLIKLNYGFEKFELARTEGTWKVYNKSENAVSNFRVKVRKDAKGGEIGIASVESN